MCTFESESTLYSCLNVEELLPRSRRDIWHLSDSNGIRTHNHLVRKRTLNHLAKLEKWLSCVVSTICTVHLIVCSYQVAYTFESESALYSCLNVKEFLVRNRADIWSLSDSNGIRTQNHLAQSQYSSIIWPVWLDGWLLIYELRILLLSVFLSVASSNYFCPLTHFAKSFILDVWQGF